jgi:hypothetical protein
MEYLFMDRDDRKCTRICIKDDLLCNYRAAFSSTLCCILTRIEAIPLLSTPRALKTADYCVKKMFRFLTRLTLSYPLLPPCPRGVRRSTPPDLIDLMAFHRRSLAGATIILGLGNRAYNRELRHRGAPRGGERGGRSRAEDPLRNRTLWTDGRGEHGEGYGCLIR